MNTRIRQIKWELHSYKQKVLLIWGLKNGLITPYDDELIEKLRKVYYGGIPASIILLSDKLTNGHCYDRALLMSRAFLDSKDDIQLLYGDIDSLKLNPKFISNSPMYADHCILERITKDGKHLIYDTSSGFVYDKKLYWLMEHPKIRKINNKETIIKFLKEDEELHPENIENDKYMSSLILPIIEKTFGRPTEMYSQLGIELLQREIEHYKKTIDYNNIIEEIDYTSIVEEVEQDIKILGLTK